MHTDPSGDLAGGNFAYINGLKGSGAADSKGHNVVNLVNQDGKLYGPPGGIVQFGHEDGLNVNRTNLTCAGNNGCHGYRVGDGFGGSTGVKSLSGAHHGNVDGKLTTATTVANSYRFLLGVKGGENPIDRWENKDASSHNEYYGEAVPNILNCSANGCHVNGYVQPPNHTISGFCATCHGNFHTLKTSTSSGIGVAAASPFIRHPNDIVIKNSGEYAAYTSYNVNAPVGRQILPDAPSGAVTPGSDVVTCLSCHVAHAGNYPDMLRWDYTL
ncbi:MAG: hypothetical protein OEV91_02630, partial [Desulfobulbaceae bacterium]|nr:hypothetical protein [Desulfobulbaceae bacterium]